MLRREADGLMATSLRAAVHDLLHEVQDALRRAGVDPRYARFLSQLLSGMCARQADRHEKLLDDLRGVHSSPPPPPRSTLRTLARTFQASWADVPAARADEPRRRSSSFSRLFSSSSSSAPSAA